MRHFFSIVLFCLLTSVFVGCSDQYDEPVDGVCMDPFRVAETIGENEFSFICYDEDEFEFQRAEPVGWDGIMADPKEWLLASALDAGNGVYLQDKGPKCIYHYADKSQVVHGKV